MVQTKICRKWCDDAPLVSVFPVRISTGGDDMPNDSRPAVLELIGNTPLVSAASIPALHLFLKLNRRTPAARSRTASAWR
jgi:hypothetical protein